MLKNSYSLTSKEKGLLYKTKQKSIKFLITIFKWSLILGLSFVIIFPLIKLMVPAITHILEVDNPTSIWFPAKFSFKTILVSINAMSYFKSLLVTVLFTSLIVVLQVFTAAITGYAFSRFNFRFKKLFMFILIMTIIVPFFTVSLSTSTYFSNFTLFGLFDLIGIGKVSFLNQWLVYAIINLTGVGLKSGLFIFIFIKFYSSIPEEIEESAMIDGVGYFRIFWNIILPNAKPALITCLVLSFVWNYGDFQNNAFFTGTLPLLPRILLLITNSPNTLIPYINDVYNYPGSATTEMMIASVQNASILLFVVPLLIGYFFIQKKFVENFERSGLVG